MYSSFFLDFFNLNFIASWVSPLAIFSATVLPIVALWGAIVFVILHHDKDFLKLSPIKKLQRKMTEFLMVFGSTLATWTLVEILKSIIAAPRPFLYFHDINPLFVYGGYDSFPSGHAAFFSALATALCLYHPRMGTLYFLLALAIGVGRIVSGIHFPLDVLAGFAIGVVVTFGTHHVLRDLYLIKE